MTAVAYTVEQMNAAIDRVEDAKARHPVGWRFLACLHLQPADSYVAYAYANARAHSERLGRTEEPIVIYAAGWMNGLAVGVALGELRGAS